MLVKVAQEGLRRDEFVGLLAVVELGVTCPKSRLTGHVASILLSVSELAILHQSRPQLTKSAFLRTYDAYSANAEPHVSFLYRLFRSGQKHLQTELDGIYLNRFHSGSETFVIQLERCFEISRVLRERIGQGCSAKNCHGATHPYCRGRAVDVLRSNVVR